VDDVASSDSRSPQFREPLNAGPALTRSQGN